jgi:tetratricopeptide (TPR) repeat protein
VHKEKGYGAVVMVNSDNGQIINEVFRSIAKEYDWEGFLPAPLSVVSVDPGKLAEYTGRFLVNPDRVLTITSEGGQLFGEPTASPRAELFPVSDNEFVRKDAEMRLTFVKGASGRVDSIRTTSPGGSTEWTRIGKDAMIPYEQLTSGRVTEAIEGYRKIKRDQPTNNVVQEGRLNDLGYTLLRGKKIAEAIAVFKLNVEFNPRSSNVYDSLGEAYFENGEKALAITNYKKALELDPNNKGAAEMLKKLQQD